MRKGRRQRTKAGWGRLRISVKTTYQEAAGRRKKWEVEPEAAERLSALRKGGRDVTKEMRVKGDRNAS